MSDDGRVWYRHELDAQRGFMVVRDGKQYIQLDRPQEEILRPYREHEWTLDRQERPLSRMQVAKLTYIADQALCEILALYDHKRPEWLNLTVEKRLAWIATGPGEPKVRKDIYRAIWEALRPMVAP